MNPEDNSQFAILFDPDFKAWDISSKCWVDTYFESQAAHCDSGTYRLHPFTGILDKNDKKIYHGDILLLNQVAVKLSDAERNHVLVGFSKGSFMYGRGADPYHMNTYLWLFARHYMVVGNIYEDKELLDVGFIGIQE